ncbi:AMP-dependent synthetase/ligase [Terasakiella sp. A23]|uniref:AMP-dependent synthetase/ligase n=1 Tax=Terasakiella sp. FCG-A23 TaxID=3080561 RepID=UPI002952F06D|nr:AMP-dependent synthetase/ligase [Terasakiella sp. A23]MDV7340552.1 AMP-dependent synthetase/ligase [Terasakiella sp. A23]
MTDNLVTLFFNQAERLGDKPFLWQKVDGTYQPTTWKECASAVIALAQSLIGKGIQKGDRVVLVSENRTEWAIADLAIMAAGAITVPTYTTNTLNDHKHILNNSQAKAAIVSTQRLAGNLLPATHEASDIEFVISIEDVDLKQELSHPIYLWADMLKEGADQDRKIVEKAATLTREDTACIIYTSGTGGTPKGVMLPHRAIMHNCQGATTLLKDIGLDNETFLSFLPLSHSYEHTAGLMWPISLGAQIYYAESADKLVNNMAECSPTVMTAVPRLYEMMRAKILRGVEQAGGKKASMFHKTVELGINKHLGKPIGLMGHIQNFALERLVRNKVRQRFGGRLKAMVSGGAPLNVEVGLFFQGIGIQIFQGYGQTETGPVISVNTPKQIKMHTVGPVLEDTELKIAADGEILVRGSLLMRGYWRNDKATQETIKDGWLHTGDIGFLDDDGYLQITDRKKDIIVNSGGDNISPQRIEGFLSLEKEIAQSMTYGDQRPHLVALIVPDEEFAFEWAKANDVEQDLSVIIKEEGFIKEISGAVSRVNQHLSNIEKVRKFILTSEAFTIENEQMTPTLKIRRHVIKIHYGDRLSALYT